MDIFIIVLLAVILLVLASLLLHLYRKDGASSDNEGSFSMLLQQLNELSKTVDQKIGEGNRQVGETLRYQFKDSQELIKEITREITEVKEVGRQTASIAEQLKSLQDVLKNPKQRGVLGEYYLETLLKNTLPTGSYAMQYAFENGEIVDAAVFVKDKVIPVDSKFSLENYNRFVEENDGSEKEKLGKLFVTDLKARIQETAKYIRPEEGTMDFAFMFIPHEAIYYDLLTNKIGEKGEAEESVIQRAAHKYRVIVVSPTSFLAYLQTVLQGLRALQIEEKAQDIIKRVSELNKHIAGYEKYQQSLGKSLATTVNHYNRTNKEFKKIDKDVMRITGESVGVEIEEIDRPGEE